MALQGLEEGREGLPFAAEAGEEVAVTLCQSLAPHRMKGSDDGAVGGTTITISRGGGLGGRSRHRAPHLVLEELSEPNSVL